MNIYSVSGACAAFASARVKDIGLSNIEGIIRTKDALIFVTYPDQDGQRWQYHLTLKLDGRFDTPIEEVRLDRGYRRTFNDHIGVPRNPPDKPDLLPIKTERDDTSKNNS